MAELWEMWLLTKLFASAPFHATSHTFSQLQLQTRRALLHQAFVYLAASARTALLLWTTHPLPGEILHRHQHQIKSSQKPSMLFFSSFVK